MELRCPAVQLLLQHDNHIPNLSVAETVKFAHVCQRGYREPEFNLSGELCRAKVCRLGRQLGKNFVGSQGGISSGWPVCCGNSFDCQSTLLQDAHQQLSCCGAMQAPGQPISCTCKSDANHRSCNRVWVLPKHLPPHDLFRTSCR